MDSIKNVEILRIKGDNFNVEEDIVVKEYPFTIFINDVELITLLCSPTSLEYLALGFIYSEGLIDSLSNVKKITIDEDKGIGYMYLDKLNEFSNKFMGKRTITSGCGKGTIFYNIIDSFRSKKIEKPITVDIGSIKNLVKGFNKKSQLFIDTGGVHSCALCSNDGIIIFEEDIGRHNALDKIFGKALVQDIDTRDKIVLTSGRISSEILIKAAKRQVPVIVSRSAPTSLSVEMAEELGITLIGFARGEKMNIYTNFPNLNI